MDEYVAYFNGEWMPYSQIRIDPGDRGFAVGDIVFDVERTFNGKTFRLRKHIDRLYRSLKYVRMDPMLSADEVLEITEDAVRRNEKLKPPGGDFWCKQFVTRGIGDLFDSPAPTVGVTVGNLRFDALAPKYEEGAHAVITRARSYPAEALDPKVKHYSRMNFVLAQMEANDFESGAWPILTDLSGNLTEGSGQNLFLVTDGVVRTPTDRAALQGVSSGMAIDLCGQLGIPLQQEDLQPYDLYTANEAFLTTTSTCVLPLTQVDGRPIGDGRPGPVAQQLLAAWSEAVGVDIVQQALQFS